ncbi:hypothetical protein AD949_10625 [Acetobacter orleanensis]|nr:hypothetical protein AD949_10625 [Acetobacter orleanensis]PCD80000.1 hypothetical protein CO710_03850 [Acetobacter orleanensis]
MDCTRFCGIMNRAIRVSGGAAAFARQHNIPVQAVRDTQNLRGFSHDVVAALGLVQVLRYPLSADPKNLVTAQHVQEKLNNFIREHKSQRIAAQIFGIHEPHLSNIQNGLRGFAPVLSILGFGPPVRRFYFKQVACHEPV